MGSGFNGSSSEVPAFFWCFARWLGREPWTPIHKSPSAECGAEPNEIQGSSEAIFDTLRLVQKTKHALVRPPSSWDWLILNDLNVAKEFDSFVCLSIYGYVYFCLFLLIYVHHCSSNLFVSMLWGPCAASRWLWGGSEKLSRKPSQPSRPSRPSRPSLRTWSSPSMAVPRSWDASFARTELWHLIWCWQMLAGRVSWCFASAGHVPALPWWVSLTCLERRITGKYQSLNSFEASNLPWIFAGITVSQF